MAGAPNAGKSALLNALAGRPAAIVNEAAGTTRDVVEVAATLGDSTTGTGALPVVLSDTAGVRLAAEAVEAEGVRRATTRWSESDLRLLVMDLGALAPALQAAILADDGGSATAEPVDTQGVELLPMVTDLLAAAMPSAASDADSFEPDVAWHTAVVLNKRDLCEDHGTLFDSPAAVGTALRQLFPGLEQISGGAVAPVFFVSCETGEGVQALSDALASHARRMLGARHYVEGGGAEGEAGVQGTAAGASTEGDAALPTRARHRVQLLAAIDALDSFLALEASGNEAGLELGAEELRGAMVCMGRLTGAVGVEDLLGIIFSEFCVGK